MSASVRSFPIPETSSRPTPGVRSGWCTVAMLAALASGLGACGKAKPVHYFQLTHPPTTTLSASQAPIDATLQVRLFRTSRLYREDRIVYGDDTVQVGLYENERWTEPPVDLLQDALARGLRSSNRFRAVTTLRSEANADYYLTGQLYAFREVSASPMVARLRFDVELMDLKEGRMIWRHGYSRDEPAAGKTIAELATAMDKNVHQAVQEIQDGIVEAVTEYTRK